VAPGERLTAVPSAEWCWWHLESWPSGVVSICRLVLTAVKRWRGAEVHREKSCTGFVGADNGIAA
jgi:hypothetical protein